MAGRKRVLTPEELAAKRARAVERVRQWRLDNPEKYSSQLARRDNAAYAKKWQEENPEKFRAQQRRAREKNRTVINERVRKWRLAHPERMAALKKRWNAANPERKKAADDRSRERNKESVKVSKQQWLERNREQARAASVRWNKNNPDKRRAARRRRYHADVHKARLDAKRRRHLRGSHTVSQWLARVSYYGWRCRWCNCELTNKTVTKDHVIAVAVGGTDWASNLVPACGPCNSGKRTKRTYAPPSTRRHP